MKKITIIVEVNADDIDSLVKVESAIIHSILQIDDTVSVEIL
jgi:hypothetical protein